MTRMTTHRADADQHPELAEHYLHKAIGAEDPDQRLEMAQRGLETEHLAPSTHMLLLRQRYLGHLEQGAPQQALDAIEQALRIGELEDVCHQDAARALVLLGRWNDAAGHLRLAARVCPAERRAFHLWTLGSGLFLEGQLQEAEMTMRKAMRWATTERPLVAAQLTLVLLAQGKPTPPLHRVIEDLEGVPGSQGYGRFVLGLLYDHAGNPKRATEHLQAFVERTERGRVATRLSLDRELTYAKRMLTKLKE